MPDWRVRLENWVRVWDRLPELIRDCYPVKPPSKAAWRKGLPICTALSDLYARCNGGTFEGFDLSRVTKLTDPSAGALADFLKLDLKPGRWLELGYHHDGHALWWDSDTDQVTLCTGDDYEPQRLGWTMEDFLVRLFYPSTTALSAETQFWAAALAKADKLSA